MFPSPNRSAAIDMGLLPPRSGLATLLNSFPYYTKGMPALVYFFSFLFLYLTALRKSIVFALKYPFST